MSHKKITRIYTSDDGRSHFEDLIVPMNELIAGKLLARFRSDQYNELICHRYTSKTAMFLALKAHS